MTFLVRPEDWYRLFWVLWTIAALIVARVWLVNPILERLDRLIEKWPN